MKLLPLFAATVLFTCSLLASGSLDEGTVIPQIVQGGAWSTDLQVINTDDEGRPMPYTISFFSNGGLQMAVRVLDGSGVSLGTQTILAGIVSYLGVDFYTLPCHMAGQPASGTPWSRFPNAEPLWSMPY